MRMRYPTLALAAVALLAPGRLAAQPKAAEPTVEVRLRSVNDLIDKAEYVGDLMDKGEPVKQVRELLKNLSADGKGVEGIDPKRPFGVYATLTPDVATSPVVVMIPVADEKRLMTTFKERLGVEPEKVEGGVFKANVPLINEVYLRFADGYLYAARDAKHLAPKTLPAPKAFFAADDGSVASVVVRFDAIPADLKTFVTGQLEHQVQEGLKKDADNETAAQKKLNAIIADAFVGSAKMLVDDGKALTLRVFADPKADEFTAEVVVTAKDGTTLAKNFAGLSGKTSLPAGIVATDAAAVKGGAKAALTDDLRKRLDPVIDKLIDDLVKQAKGTDQVAARRVLDTLAPTLKAGELDFAAALAGPDAKGRHALLVAAAVKDGQAIAKLAKDFAPFAGDNAEFTFDVEKVGAFALHKIVVKNDDAEFERVFGTKTIWLATSDATVALSIEPAGALLKAGLKAKPAPVAVFSTEVALAKALPLFNKELKPDEVKALLKDAFGAAPAGKDTIAVAVEGGSKLTTRVTVKGMTFRLAAKMDELKKK